MTEEHCDDAVHPSGEPFTDEENVKHFLKGDGIKELSFGDKEKLRRAKLKESYYRKKMEYYQEEIKIIIGGILYEK
jgi:hypothetical protein